MVKRDIAIIGASSRLGSAVVSALQNSPTFGPLAVRVVDDSALSDNVCDKARFNQLCNDLTDVAGCFLCSSTDDNYSIDCSEAEAQRGKTVVDACAVAGVPYVIYNTRLGVYDSIGVPSRHMDACAEVERYFKVKGIRLTSLVVTFTYEQLLVQPFLPIRTADGILDLGRSLTFPCTANKTYVKSHF